MKFTLTLILNILMANALFAQADNKANIQVSVKILVDRLAGALHRISNMTRY
jgi:hypothetical protein